MKHKLLNRYFQNIDNTEKAYWLGFLYADGYVASKAPWTCICQIKDIEHLEKFRQALSFTGEVKIKEILNGYSPSTMGRLTICRKELCLDLISHGCKSNDKKTIETKFQPAYWRGIFDGDGCISLSCGTQEINGKIYGPYNKATCYIILQRSDVNSFIKILSSLDIKYQVTDSISAEMQYVRFSSLGDIMKFGDWIYSESGPYLERKRSKFETLRSLLSVTTVE